MQHSIIVAVGENGVMGRGGGLPWHLSSDLKIFRRLTMGKPMIMGRKTFQCLEGPLDGRDNIVVSRNACFDVEGVFCVTSLDEAFALSERLAAERGVDEVTIIGGAEIYQAALPKVTRIYKTLVHAAPEGDTFFPELEEGDWREISREDFKAGEKDDFDFSLIVLERKAL